MIKIDYPPHSFRIKAENNTEFIFDELRRSWLRLTAEEWVRQNFVQYLIQIKEYPASLIAIEREIHLGELRKRFDILVYDHEHKPWMMIECKEMNVRLDEKVFEQLLRYNIAVPVKYMVITNGIYCTGYEKSNNRLELLHSLPAFQS
jgi:hypothetical protein